MSTYFGLTENKRSFDQYYKEKILSRCMQPKENKGSEEKEKRQKTKRSRDRRKGRDSTRKKTRASRNVPVAKRRVGETVFLRFEKKLQCTQGVNLEHTTAFPSRFRPIGSQNQRPSQTDLFPPQTLAVRRIFLKKMHSQFSLRTPVPTQKPPRPRRSNLLFSHLFFLLHLQANNLQKKETKNKTVAAAAHFPFSPLPTKHH